MFPLYIPGKHQETFGFLVLSGIANIGEKWFKQVWGLAKFSKSEIIELEPEKPSFSSQILIHVLLIKSSWGLI